MGSRRRQRNAKARYRSVAIVVHGIGIRFMERDGDLFYRVVLQHPHSHEIHHATYTTPLGQRKLGILWHIAESLPDDTYVRMIADTYMEA